MVYAKVIIIIVWFKLSQVVKNTAYKQEIL